jgi:CPA2 family monovalent cation:H+ antiporter-2
VGEHTIFQQTLILLVTAVAGVALLRRINLPPILAYLAIGVLLGPHALGVVDESEDVRFLAEFGVVFLLFTIGLEFSLPQLWSMRRAVLGLGGSQVVVTALAAGGVALLAGIPLAGCFAIGGIVAMSSTAIVSKQLTEQLELQSRHGRESIAILLFQDIAVIPFLLLIPLFGAGPEQQTVGSIALAMVKGTAIFVIILLLGLRGLRPMLRLVASARSDELFMMSVLTLALLAAWATHEAGLSLALGAFLAGMMIGETEFRHQVENDIRPFRDVLLGLFFVTVGMLLDPALLPAIWPWVALLLPLVVLAKAAIIFLISRTLGSEPGVALRSGLTLANLGEFSFVLLSLAVAHGLLPVAVSQPLLVTAILSMALAPLLIRANYTIATRLFPESYAGGFEQRANEVALESSDLSGHVVLCGYGQFGQAVARVLDQEGVDHVALDLDAHRVAEAHDAGFRVHYGDATRSEMLESAGTGRSAAVVICYRSPIVAERILHHIRSEYPGLPVLARARDAADIERLRRLGASEVFPESLETSLMLSGQLLLRLGHPAARVLRRMRQVHTDHYGELRGYFAGESTLRPLPGTEETEQLHSVTLAESAHAVGLTIHELDLDALGVMVTAVRRGGIRGPQPDPETCLQAGDVVVLHGLGSALHQAEQRLLLG